MDRHKACVIILNYNGKHLLQQFMPSVVKCTPAPIPIYVFDNHSLDGSVDWLSEEYPTVSIIQSDKNLGFAEGYNMALRKLDAEYFILLNNDVQVTEHWVEPIIAFMDKNKDVAVVQPKILSYKNKTHFEYAGAAGGLIDILGYTFCYGRCMNHTEKDIRQYDTIQPIFWASGAAFFIRSNAWAETKGFDPNFFAHMEEVDICWRLQNRGYKIIYFPQSTVYHLGGGTLQSASSYKLYLNFRNNLLTLWKNLRTVELCIILPLRFFFDFLSLIKFIVKRDLRSVSATHKAHLHFFVLAKKVKRVKGEKKKLTQLFGTNRASIIIGYYLFGRRTASEFKRKIKH